MWSETAMETLLNELEIELSAKPQSWALLNTIFRNIVAHPVESKYRNINKAKISDRIATGLRALELVGFRQSEEESGTYSLSEELVPRVVHAVGVLDEIKARPLIHLRAQREAAVTKIEQKALQASKSNKYKPEKFSTKPKPKPNNNRMGVAALVNSPRDPNEGLDRELDYLTTKIQKIENKLQILHGLGSCLNFATNTKTIPPQTFVEELWKGPLWGVELVVELLRRLQSDSTARYLLLSKHLARLEEAQGALPLLFHVGFESKENALVMSPEHPLSEASSLLTVLQARLHEAGQVREANRQAALTRMVEARPSPDSLPAEVARATARLQELQEAQTNLKAVMGTPFRIEWTIMGWTGKELTPELEYPCFPLVEENGRQWRAYARKSFHNKERDKIGVFLQCVANPKNLPVQVGLHITVLHRQSARKIECVMLQKDPLSFYEIREFSPQANTWGFSNFTSTQEAILMGALQPAEDKITFRVDFCVK